MAPTELVSVVSTPLHISKAFQHCFLPKAISREIHLRTPNVVLTIVTPSCRGCFLAAQHSLLISDSIFCTQITMYVWLTTPK